MASRFWESATRAGSWATSRAAFFTPEEDGTYYFAVGAGAEDRGGGGYYTLSVRVDDHADDYRPDPDVSLLPGQSIAARIDSDVAPDHPGLNPWDWAANDGEGVPVYGIESLDDRDVFRVEISEKGQYYLAVSDGPQGVGIWSIFDDLNPLTERDTAPVAALVHTFLPGTYYVEVGTHYESEGAAGPYTFLVANFPDSDANAPGQ